MPTAGGPGLPTPGGAGLPSPGGPGWPAASEAGWPVAAGGGADELELPLTGEDPNAAIVRQAGGGTAFGEVNLEGGDTGGVLEAEVPTAPDDMEFGAIPQETSAPEHMQPVPIAPQPMPLPGATPAKKRRVGLRAAAAIVVVLALGGAALALVPSVGPFGAYWIADKLQSGEHKSLIAKTLSEVHGDLGKDTYPSAKHALEVVDKARASAKRLKSMAAYSAYVIELGQLRFGADAELDARAKVLLDELKEEQDVEFLPLARAAQAAAEGQLPRARQLTQSLESKAPRDIDVLVLRGELELLAKDPKAAETAWMAAEEVEKSARTAFGLARAKQAMGAGEDAKKLARTALERSPAHVGAKTLLARQMWKTERKEVEATKLLEEVTSKKADASPEELVGAETLLGDIHLSRSRISHAEAAYAEALKIDPKASGALAGLGDALYRAGRYSEALARFEAGVQADPDDIAAKVGVAKATLALERLQDARAAIKKLRETHPKSMLVAYWFGKIEEASGDRKTAEAAYRDAIKIGGKDPDAVVAYVGLALLLGQQGRTEEAQKVLADARDQLPDSPAIHIALGELAQSQGRYDAAVSEFREALKLDPGDVGAKFRLGAALRRDRKFEEATKVFDEVAKVDRDYPGLALERGLLYEASGRTDEALKAYESALAKAPNDPDLMLRVGCGKTVSGRAAEAVKLLGKVLEKRPNSAETHHCLGRALLVEGKNLAEALKNLQRAADLDPNRAEYFLYVGWAANEAGRLGVAETALRKALDLDQGLADAYWQRGVLRAREGAVKDAVKDLQKALELRPSRFEAHAALADAYNQLSREDDAMSEWQKALSESPNNATWRYRYGKLLVDNRRTNEAQEQLDKAVELGDAMDPKPDWIYEAHYQLARALGPRKEAIKHWEAFLRGGPKDSPYRVDAKKALAQLGRPWDGD